MEDALAALGKPSGRPSDALRGLIDIDGGGLMAKPYTLPAGKYIGYPEDTPCLNIGYLESIVPGGGRRALAKLLALADAKGLPVILSAVSYPTVLYPMPMPMERLKKYYTEFGFKPLTPVNQGKWLAHMMVRIPSS